MDIRNFFKAGASRPGAAKQATKQEGNAAAAGKEAKQQAADQKSKYFPGKDDAPAPAGPSAKASAKAAKIGSQKSKGTPAKPAAARAAKAAAAAAASGGGSARKRKKKDDSDDEVVLVSDDGDDDDDDDESYDVMSLDDEDNESNFVVDESDEDTKPKPAKRAKASTPAKPKAAAAAKASPAAKGRGKASKGPQMVIEKKTDSQEGSAKKRKLPGSMAGQAAPVAPKAPKKATTDKKELSADAKAAVAAVDKAAAALPALEKSSLSFAEGGGGWGQAEQEPPEPGSKDVPQGHPDAFTGKTFVFSGVLSSMYRDQAKELILQHGGRVTGDVSGKTTFLVIGDTASRRKYEKAVEKGVQVIDEDGLLALAAASKPAAQPTPPPAAQPAASSQQKQQPAAAASSHLAAAGSGGGRGAAVPVMGAAAFHGANAAAAAVAGPSGGGAGSSRAAAAAAAPRRPGGDQLWVDKYKPKSITDLVGNQGLVQTLRQWLYQWNAVHLQGATPEQPKGAGGGKPKDMTKKAVLLSGPPGIGKTSSAHIIAKECGFSVVEVNASDTRSKSDNKAGTGMGGKLANIVREMVTSNALAAASGAKRQQVLIMDECDGMSAGDRGGVADLINTIKLSKIPIICICNDKYSQKLRSLRNHCMELDYRKPTADQIGKRMQWVCQQEGLSVNDATMRTLIEGAQGDLRLVLGQLQMTRLRSASLDFTAAKALGAHGKDADMSPFSAASKLLEPRGASRSPSVSDQLELVFADADLVPLLVQENYVNHRPDIASQPDLRLRALAKAADAISVGDVVNQSVRRYGNWGLMPFGGLMGCVVPAAYMHGPRETFELYEMNFTRFSAWFGVNSHTSKQRRLLAELSCCMAASEAAASTSRAAMRLDYLPALDKMLVQPLVTEGEEGIPKVLLEMQAYCINKDQFDYIRDVTHYSKTKAPWNVDPYEEKGAIDSKVKSAFTRTFNKQGLKPRTNTMVEEVSTRGARGKSKAKGGRGRGSGGEGDELAGEGVAADAEGGAALAEEANVPEANGEVKSEDEEEEQTPEQLAAQMRGEGISIQLKPEPGGKSGGRSAGGKSAGGKSAGGRGAGRGGGRGAASGRGAGSGRGRGRGK